MTFRKFLDNNGLLIFAIAWLGAFVALELSGCGRGEASGCGVRITIGSQAADGGAP